MGVGKATGMGNYKTLDTHRAAIERTIVKLAPRRDALRQELDQVEEELKRLLAMAKIAGVAASDATPPAVDDAGAHTVPLLASGPVPELGSLARRVIAMCGAEHTSVDTLCDPKGSKLFPPTKKGRLRASNLLSKLYRAGYIERVSRGVYAGTSSKTKTKKGGKHGGA